MIAGNWVDLLSTKSFYCRVLGQSRAWLYKRGEGLGRGVTLGWQCFVSVQWGERLFFLAWGRERGLGRRGVVGFGSLGLIAWNGREE